MQRQYTSLFYALNAIKVSVMWTNIQLYVVSASSVTTYSPVQRPRDCADIVDTGCNISGVYRVYVTNGSRPLSVYCDMSTTGGGWTVKKLAPICIYSWHIVSILLSHPSPEFAVWFLYINVPIESCRPSWLVQENKVAVRCQSIRTGRVNHRCISLWSCTKPNKSWIRFFQRNDF
jgi:Fibrinogen beta and gamma chains, C-terminal globular domain